MAFSLLPFVLPIFVVGLVLLWRSLQSKRLTNDHNGIVQDHKQLEVDPYEAIEPLHDFDWASTEPIKMRPFKPIYHLTMGLENIPLSELIAIDNTYLDRIKTRELIMDEHSMAAFQCHTPCEAAVTEMYEWMFGVYLPRRFPTMFKIVPSSELPADVKANGPCLHNIPAGRYIPLAAPSANEALSTLGKNVDTDILILLPSSTAEDGSPIYHLEAYVTCFPAGFSLPEKYCQPLATIHKPVPGYKAKLEKSMDRFFAKLEVGKAVRRANWSITTSPDLFSQAGNHLYANGQTKENMHDEDGIALPEDQKILDANAPDLNESIARQKQDVVIEQCRFRCERQTLHRLPKTKAIVFAFKTYIYKLDDIKAEGSGHDLADAITGLTKGSVPDIAYYKREVVWGEPVVEYLRS